MVVLVIIQYATAESDIIATEEGEPWKVQGTGFVTLLSASQLPTTRIALR